MKTTYADLLELMCLKVGDLVEVKIGDEKRIFRVKSEKNLIDDETKEIKKISYILDCDYKILPRTAKIGDLKCGDLYCRECPFKIFKCDDLLVTDEKTLFETNKQIEKFNPDIAKALEKILSTEIKVK